MEGDDMEKVGREKQKGNPVKIPEEEQLVT